MFTVISAGGSDPGNLHCSSFHSQSPLHHDSPIAIPSLFIGHSAHVAALWFPQETSSTKVSLVDTFEAVIVGFGVEMISVGESDPSNLHCSSFHSQSPLHHDSPISLPSFIGHSLHVAALWFPQEVLSTCDTFEAVIVVFGVEMISVEGSDPSNLHCSSFHSQSPLHQDEPISLPSFIGHSLHVAALWFPQEAPLANARVKGTSKMKEKFREIIILTKVW